jgi:hypothetical protein
MLTSPSAVLVVIGVSLSYNLTKAMDPGTVEVMKLTAPPRSSMVDRMLGSSKVLREKKDQWDVISPNSQAFPIVSTGDQEVRGTDTNGSQAADEMRHFVRLSLIPISEFAAMEARALTFPDTYS